MNRLFARSPLALNGTLPHAEVARICAIYGDPKVQRLADQLCGARAHLAEVAAYRGGIAEAIEVAGSAGGSVVESLLRLIREAKDEIQAARADHDVHDAVRKARNELLRPLAVAVGSLSSSLSMERQGLQSRIDAGMGAHTPAESSRYTALRAAGLSDVQISDLGVESPEVGILALRDRAAVVDSMLAQCMAFGADPFKSPEHLAGLGFDTLIETRTAAEQASA